MTKSTIDDKNAAAQAPGHDQQAHRADAPKAEAPQAQAPRTEVPFSEREVPPPPRKRFGLIVVVGVACLLAYGAFKHYQTYQLASDAQQDVANFVPEVQTITVKTDGEPVKLTLPGQTEPFFQSTVYPRATGYIAERKVDIGSHVKKGDLLLRISAPDLDQQLAQAKGRLLQNEAAQAQAQATLDQAKANLALAQLTSQRYQKLTTQGYETVQNNDNQKTAVTSGGANVEAGEAGIKVAAANTKAAQASVDQQQALVDFERVVAPYDGVITTRNVEVGDLVQADQKSGSPLFTIAYDKVLRVTVHVPQANAFGIHDGIAATAFLPEKPEQTFSGKIARSSIALLNSARTLDTEADIDNPTGALRPGAFVNVSFDVPRLHPNVVLPSEALIFDAHGMQAATVQDDEVHMVNITIYRDFGKTVELRDGLNGGEQVVINPPIDLAEHSKVKVKPKQENEAKK